MTVETALREAANRQPSATTTSLPPAPIEPRIEVEPFAAARVEVAGKFLTCGGEAFFLRGVTYGPFAPEPDGSEYHTPAIVEHDFALMAASGLNTVRTYTPPPDWLLDIAYRHGLRVFIGLPWEQHVTFLDSSARQRAIAARVRRDVAACARHPAVLGYAVGNEIPPSVVRWHGRRRIERFVRRLYEEAKSEHPDALITYVNFPTTEYLELPFLDFFAWNVYLENRQSLARYLARLQNLAAEKPLVLAEIGLDSRRNGDRKQAEVLDWQIRAAGAAGCAGAIVFSWTDEWHRSGEDIHDWDFGLTDRERRPKPALARTAAVFAEFPLPPEVENPPLVSVVVCSYNGSRTLRETLDALCRLDYPRYEVIVVNDGSTDETPRIAAEFPVRLISTENRGLSHARNLGLREALGEIVAYVDDDAYPDRLWLRYLVRTLLDTQHVGVGGPNVSPPSDDEVAQCVSHAPGGPNHVLLSDALAEHIPGCNMAFRRDALLAIGGFDERFRIAGDDVDLCWRLQERGGTIGFHPAAMVWHHSRNRIGAYLKQQYNYGRAEAMLEAKWPSKYNSIGYPRWEGRVYGRGHREPVPRRWAVYHGVWASNLFQTLYVRPPGVVASLPLLPEWYLLILVLALSSAVGLLWSPLLWSVPALLSAVGVLLCQAATAAWRAPLPWRSGERWRRSREHLTIALLHLLQPVMRLRGRLSYGLHPLRRRRGSRRLAAPRRREHSQWSETWRSGEQRREDLERRIKRLGARVRRGGSFDEWDLEVRGGLFGGIRLLMAIEEHGQGRQLVRVRSWPFLERWTLPTVVGLGGMGVLAALAGALTAGAVFGAADILLASYTLYDWAAASSVSLTLASGESTPGGGGRVGRVERTGQARPRHLQEVVSRKSR